MTLTALILAHVAANPGSGATEISLALDRGRDTVAAILSQQRRKGAIEVVCRKTVNGRSWPEVKYQAAKNPPAPTPATNHGGAKKGVPPARAALRPCCPDPHCGSLSLKHYEKGDTWACNVCKLGFKTPAYREPLTHRRAAKAKPLRRLTGTGSGVIAGPITVPQYRWGGSRLG